MSQRKHRRPRLETLEDRCVPSVFTVTTTADDTDGGDGTLSLREAILAVNGDATDTAQNPDQIVFHIPGSGAHTISPGSALPAITAPVTIDGYSQPGASMNTLTNGDNAVLQI